MKIKPIKVTRANLLDLVVLDDVYIINTHMDNVSPCVASRLTLKKMSTVNVQKVVNRIDSGETVMAIAITL